MKYVLTSIEMFAGIAKKLINHLFFVTICGATAQSFTTNVDAILTGLDIARTLAEIDLLPGSSHHPVSPLSSSIVCFPFVPLLDVAHRPCFLLYMSGTIQGKYVLPSLLRSLPPNSRREFPCRRSKSNGSPLPDHRHCGEAHSLLHLS